MTETTETERVCKVCHRSIPRTADRERREALVHRDCLAELRCGITLRGTGGERTRERDTR
ncbi:hypothetical protein [Haloarcula onubensis]|uniref:Uncharacterized protein n=1 Tax=Haloarcula onubensis TaxID=2950539 RepID=A0ABU2FLE9_9EURY|nr:hypothetical protein [Halomicroarcula sp. S3CR25-11]MDS0281579.1 hypothetical protein [Halomicroarcula sp. S3CR25-11]